MSTKAEVMESMEKTKQGFEESFLTGTFYNKQTKDEKHLALILNALPIKAGMKVLDLGTGTGYLAFPIAQNYPKAEVTGLDIVENALNENSKKAEEEKLSNLKFVSYNGIVFPFEDEQFDIVITRYALHHFPLIKDTFQEIERVLKKTGYLFISDPTPNDDDTEGFVDAYMQMKKDGHIKFYTKSEWMSLAQEVGLKYVDDFETSIRFPKKRETALEFDDIMKKYDAKVIEGYDIEEMEDEIYITERVNNILFVKGVVAVEN